MSRSLTARNPDRFAGISISAADARVEAIGPGLVIGCLGTDDAMLDVVSDLVADGRQVKVFDDRPRQVLPRLRIAACRGAQVLSLAGTVVGAAGGVGSAAGLGLLAAPLSHLRTQIDDRSAAALRRQQVPDRWTRRQLTPHRFDRRPPARHDRYLAAVASAGCELVSWPVASVTATGIRTCDGIEHRLDLLVLAG